MWDKLQSVGHPRKLPSAKQTLSVKSKDTNKPPRLSLRSSAGFCEERKPKIQVNLTSCIKRMEFVLWNADGVRSRGKRMKRKWRIQKWVHEQRTRKYRNCVYCYTRK